MHTVQCTVTHQSIISSHLNNLSCLNNSNSNIILLESVKKHESKTVIAIDPPKWLPNQIYVRVRVNLNEKMSI